MCTLRAYGSIRNRLTQTVFYAVLPAERETSDTAPIVELADIDIKLIVFVWIDKRAKVPHVTTKANVIAEESDRTGAQVESELAVIDVEHVGVAPRFGLQHSEASREIRPESRIPLPAERQSDDGVPHRSDDVGSTVEIDIVVIPLEELGCERDVRFPAEDPAAHPAE